MAPTKPPQTHLVNVVVDLVDLLLELEVHHVEVPLVGVEVGVLPVVPGLGLSRTVREVEGRFQGLGGGL